MVIKATRIRASAGCKALVRHLLAGDDNEAISIITGTVADVEDAVMDARAFSRTYALRHFMLAPAIPMDRDQFLCAAEMLGEEFGFEPSRAFIVEHTKVRAVAEAADRHWHLVVAETDPVTGRVLSSSFDQARHEKIARQIELLFSQPIVPGAHDLAVLAALRAEGKDDLADRLDGHLGLGPRPVEAFTSSAHQAAKRGGVDLAQARQHVRSAWAASTTGDEFRERLAAHGLELAAGDKPGVTIIRTISGVVLGAANRLAGVRRSELEATGRYKARCHCLGLSVLHGSIVRRSVQNLPRRP